MSKIDPPSPTPQKVMAQISPPLLQESENLYNVCWGKGYPFGPMFGGKGWVHLGILGEEWLTMEGGEGDTKEKNLQISDLQRLKYL